MHMHARPSVRPTVCACVFVFLVRRYNIFCKHSEAAWPMRRTGVFGHRALQCNTKSNADSIRFFLKTLAAQSLDNTITLGIMTILCNAML